MVVAAERLGVQDRCAGAQGPGEGGGVCVVPVQMCAQTGKHVALCVGAGDFRQGGRER
ncbi:hypothetical protein JCM4914_73010 [Streptomyces platensis subsp. malvinus]